MTAAGRPGPTRRTSPSLRWPALVLVPALLLAAWLLDGDDAAPAEEAPDAQVLGSQIAGSDALGAFWFCAGGTGVPDGIADHTVVLVNTTDQDRIYSAEVFGSRPDGGERPDPVTVTGRVPPYRRVAIHLADHISAPYVSATVEIDGGGVLVEHTVTGPAGTDRAPCSSVTSAAWTVPAGTTHTAAATAEAREILVFFNPYPADAVLEVAFSTEDGVRTPDGFKGFVVPGRSVVGVDLAATSSPVTLADEVAADIVARAGRVVVDRIQVYAQAPTRSGLALSGGVPTPAEAWSFPVGGLGPARSEQIVVYNPDDLPADVDVEIRPSVSDVAGIEPFELTIQPHRHELLDLSGEERLAAMREAGTSYSIIVRSADGTRITAERIAWVTPGQPGQGVATSTGSALAGLRLVADMDGAEAGSSLVVVNPSNETIARVELAIIDTEAGTLGEPAGASSIEIEPGARRVIRVEDLATGSFAVVVTSNEPVIAARDVVSGGDRHEAVAVPDADGASVAELSLFSE